MPADQAARAPSSARVAVARDSAFVPAFVRIERDNLRDQVYAMIKAAIITGTLQPGETYSVQYFADQYGVSRTPVREALLELADRGFVEVRPNRGFRIVNVSEKEQNDIAAMREMLEVPAMGQLAQSITEEAIARARELCEVCLQESRSDNMARVLEVDRTFHLYLTDLLDNDILSRTVAWLRERMHLHGLPYHMQTGQLVATSKEHVDLVDALAAHDSQLARRVMRRHIQHLPRHVLIQR